MDNDDSGPYNGQTIDKLSLQMIVGMSRHQDFRTSTRLELPLPRTPPLASAFGDTDGEFFGRKKLRPNVASTTVDAEVFFFEML